LPIAAVLRDYLVEHRQCTGSDGNALAFGRSDTRPFEPNGGLEGNADGPVGSQHLLADLGPASAHKGRLCKHFPYGAAWESNPPSRGLHDLAGFEDRLGHRPLPLRRGA